MFPPIKRSLWRISMRMPWIIQSSASTCQPRNSSRINYLRGISLRCLLHPSLAIHEGHHRQCIEKEIQDRRWWPEEVRYFDHRVMAPRATKHPYHSSKYEWLTHIEKPGTRNLLMKERAKLCKAQKNRVLHNFSKRWGTKKRKTMKMVTAFKTQ